MEADSLQIETKPRSNIGFEESFFIRANLPLDDFDESLVKLIDTDSVDVPFKTQLNRFQNQIEIAFDKTENTTYQMQILPEAIKDFYGHTNDSINQKLKTKSLADFSIMDLTITNLVRYPAIVQLVDDKEKVIKSATLKTGNRHVFEYIKPGNYFIKVIYDDNANGIWDKGDYLKQIQPEDVIYTKESLEFRPNFDYVETLRLP
jgi:hypothetical protein